MAVPPRSTIYCCFIFILAVRLPEISGTVDGVGTLFTEADDKPFKIAVFADLHFGENSWTNWGPFQDLNSVRVMSDVLDTEKPGFVIYLGDVITANNMMTRNASRYWSQAISPTKARRIPWSSVYGNHDDAAFEWPMEWFSAAGIPKLRCSATRSLVSSESSLLSSKIVLPSFVIDALLDTNHTLGGGDEGCRTFRGTSRLELLTSEIRGNPLSLTKGGPLALWPSVSNYVIQLSSPNDAHKAILYMYFFDSGGGSYPEVISDAQAKWFQQRSNAINPNSSVPEVIFWHIPSQKYKEVAPTKKAPGHCVGSIFLENVAAQEAEMGMMNFLEQRPSVKAVFVGHNHGLDWCCPYKSLWLCFARHTGYGGYGSWLKGARILEIQQKPFSLKSWIRMEDGEMHSEVVLSA